MKSPIKFVQLPSYVLPCTWAKADGTVRSLKDAKLAFRCAEHRRGRGWLMGGAEVVRYDGTREVRLF